MLFPVLSLTGMMVLKPIHFPKPTGTAPFGSNQRKENAGHLSNCCWGGNVSHGRTAPFESNQRRENAGHLSNCCWGGNVSHGPMEKLFTIELDHLGEQPNFLQWLCQKNGHPIGQTHKGRRMWGTCPIAVAFFHKRVEKLFANELDHIREEPTLFTLISKTCWGCCWASI